MCKRIGHALLPERLTGGGSYGRVAFGVLSKGIGQRSSHHRDKTCVHHFLAVRFSGILQQNTFYGVVMRTVLAALALVFAVHNRAEAGILVEPYLGYQMMVTDLKLGAGAGSLDGQSVKLDASGIGYGLRAGITLPMIFAAVDYSMASLSSSLKEAPAGITITSGTTARTSLGLTAGLSLPMVRPYVGYIFDDQSKDDTDTLSGSGFKLGVGLTVFPMVKLNAEYQMVTYTKSKDSSGTETTIGGNEVFSAVTSSGFFVNLSVPLDF